MEIRNLNGISVRQIHASFKEAFSDYAEPWNKTVEELKETIERRGFNPTLSFGAFDNGTLASFTLNGIGKWNGRLTAYDTGTGTIPAYRKQGLAARIFNEGVAVLKQHGIDQYLLEVIRVNTGAFDLYKKQGFEVIRELDYYISTKDKLVLKHDQPTLAIKPINEPNWDLLREFWEFQPSWQNSQDAIRRKRPAFVILGAFDSAALVGYGIVEKTTGDIPQLAVDNQYRRRGIATALVGRLLEHSDSANLKFINADAAYTPFRKFMASIGLKRGHGQYEMIRNL